jgi:hypothetical protein
LAELRKVDEGKKEMPPSTSKLAMKEAKKVKIFRLKLQLRRIDRMH